MSHGRLLAAALVAVVLAVVAHAPEAHGRRLRLRPGFSRPRLRAWSAYRLRVSSATRNFRDAAIPVPVDNGDEERYADFRNSFSKGLPHNELGEVDPAAYNQLLEAIETADPERFENLTMGVGDRRLANPQGMYNFYLEGRDTNTFFLAPAAEFASAFQACEAAEVLWQAVTRDVPFSEYETDPLIGQAVDDLNRFTDCQFPTEADGSVSRRTLFRGIGAGEEKGPYVSQFLLKPVPVPGTLLEQKYDTPANGNDHVHEYDEWLAIQNGAAPSGTTSVNFTGERTHISNGRRLAEYVLKDFAVQAYLHAAQIINGFGDDYVLQGAPVVGSQTQQRGPFWGLNMAVDLLGRVSSPVLSQAWVQKWAVHRRARPEVYFGRVHNHLTGAKSYDVHAEMLASPALNITHGRYGTYLLPMCTPNGSPTHPSYPAGHATLAGAGATVLKAIFSGDKAVPSPVVASDDGASVEPYDGDETLTVEGEINKLASNIALGRDTAGVHFRADGDLGLQLGEEMAISVMQDLVNTYNDEFQFEFNKFDGTPVVISKTAH